MCLMVLEVKIIRGRHQLSEDTVHTLRFRTNISEDAEMSRALSSNDAKDLSVVVLYAAEDENQSGS